MEGLPESVRVVEDGGRVSLFLPGRELGAWRFLFLIPFVFVGLVAAGIGWGFAGTFLELVFGRQHPPTALVLGGFVLAVFILSMVLPGFRWPYVIFLFGLAAFIPARTEIQIDETWVRDREHVGPFFITALKRRRGSFERIEVASAGIGGREGKFYSIQLLPSAVSTQKDFAPAYPRELLEPVARDMAARLAMPGAAAVLEAATPPSQAMPVTVEAAEPVGDQAVHGKVLIERHVSPEEVEPVLPGGSKIVAAMEGGMLTMVLPRTGLRGAALFFLFFAVMWNGISWTAFLSILMPMFRQFEAMSMLMLGFLSLFLGIGLLMAAVTVHFAMRKSVVVASPEMLVITQSSPIRKTEMQWEAGKLVDIRVGDSGTKINDKALKEVQVFATDREKAGFFEGRTEEEVRYVAAVLRRFYMRKG